MGGQPAYLIFNHGVSAGMGREFRIRSELEAFFSKPSRKCGRVRNDQRNDELALISNNHGIEDVGTGLQRAFDRLRGHKLSRSGFEKILFAVSDKQIVVPIEVADITGAKQSVFRQDLTRCAK